MGDMICEAREAKSRIKIKTIPQTRNHPELDRLGLVSKRISGTATWMPVSY
jgi:hypothetical protein